MAFGKKENKKNTGIAQDGMVHATLMQISFTEIGAVWGKGNMLDDKLTEMQHDGAQILNVTCFASGKSNDYVQAVIVYRAPMHTDLRPGY